MKNWGKFGENLTCNFLIKRGYKILDRNYRFRPTKNLQKGEIDIVAKKNDRIIFIEVKTLKNPKIGIFPEEKISFNKKRKLVLTAESWLIKNKIPLDSKWQIDVISVLIKDNKVKISHFENVVSEDFSN